MCVCAFLFRSFPPLSVIRLADMVGRRNIFTFGTGYASSINHKKGDNPFRPKPAAFKFQDVTNKAIEDERRNQIKNKLIDSVKGDELEFFRKSDDEVLLFSTSQELKPILTSSQLKTIENPKIRKFYEEQNEALNDWLEVDSVVRSIADDIFESFDPDRDHDGLLEHGGALQAQGEDVEAFLPEEERKTRRKAEKSARRAINVCKE